MLSKLEHKDTWSGKYKGITFEIAKWFTGTPETDFYHPIWNYYLYISIEQIPKQLQKDFNLEPQKLTRRWIDYAYSQAIFSNWEWHGGVTYYEKLGVDTDLMFKLGCDYNHLWDDGMDYELPVILAGAMETIDSAREHIPNLKYWCFVTGKFYPESEGLITNDGNFISFEGHKETSKSKDEKNIVVNKEVKDGNV